MWLVDDILPSYLHKDIHVFFVLNLVLNLSITERAVTNDYAHDLLIVNGKSKFLRPNNRKCQSPT